VKPLRGRLIIGDIAAQRLWGKGTAAQRAVDVLDGTFAQQRAFIEDPAKLKWALCTRRAAKSYSDGLALAKAALDRQDVSCLYIGLTRESAKRIMWKDVLKAINRRHKLGVQFNESELSAKFPNGSVIYLVGADSNEDERQKLLGQKFVLVVIDEAQAFGIDLRQLVYGVLKPAVADYRGTIVLTGTPGNLIKGLFFDVTNGREAGWSGHRWTTYDNPYMAEQWAGEIADLKAASPLVVETPWFRQMYLGEWVIDSDKLVYRFNSDRNAFAELPTFHAGQWHYVLGVDLGYNDPTAFALCAYHDYDKTLYVLEAEKHPRLDVTSVAERIRGFQARYELDSIVIDGANKQAVEEMRRRHELPLRAADKTGKSDFIEIMNGEFIQARIKLNPLNCSQLADEYAGLIWDERSLKREEHPNCANDLADAALYAWRLCYSYLSVAVDPPPKVGSPEWHQQEEEEMMQAEIRRYHERREAEADSWGMTVEEYDWATWERT
jgi:terminase large subunit-like protein